MRVSDIMTKHVQACRPEDSLREAAAIMRDRDCGAVPVLDGRQELVGMITDRDICLCAAEHDEPLSKLQISAAITWKPLTCSPDEEIECAEDKMAKHQVRRLPVVDDTGRLIGILALADVARSQAAGKSKSDEKKKVATTVAAISRPMAQATA
jgi:CBS domain-containing protein